MHVLLAVVVGAGPVSAQQFSAADRTRLVATIWSGARYNYPSWDRVQADWDSAFDVNVALAAERQSDVTFWRRLSRLVALLNDGQAEIVPPAGVRARMAQPPLLIRAIQGRPFILDYAENDEMRIARPERLAEILSVQEIPAATWIRDSVLPITAGTSPPSRWDRAVSRMLVGERGTALHLLLRLPGGAERGASVTRTMPVFERGPFERPALEVDSLPDGVYLVRLNSCSDANLSPRFDRLFPTFSGARGVILDLRENPGTGGGRENGYRVLARLVGHAFLTSRWRTPQYRPAYRGGDMPDSSGAWFSAPPDTVTPPADLPSFTGPVALLSSPRTAGAALDLLVAFRNAQRGPIIGETSGGGTGQVLALPLPGGWSFRLTVTRDAFPDGTEFTATGILPEQPVVETVASFQMGNDAALERARAYLRERNAVPKN
jgi:carboxyl-terminal processing protease